MGRRALLSLCPTMAAAAFFTRKLDVSRTLSCGFKQVAHRSYSAKASSALQPPDVPRLAETARISLTPDEVDAFAPKIRQVIHWFGELQTVDLQSIEAAIRADTGGDNLRDDLPTNFGNRDAMIAAVPNYEEPYIKVPKVLNKE